jgi:glycosyltransferase involved in cell wall biosynthesis
MVDLLVSCLMVTRPSLERLPLVQRGIESYMRQVYRRTELVIALDDGPEEAADRLKQYVAALGRTDVRVVRAPHPTSLGALRNFAMSQASGDLLAVWDDDDIQHPRRLDEQVRALVASGAIGVFLSEALHFFVDTNELYWTNYKNSVQKCLPGTGVVSRSVAARYPETGPRCARGEDTEFCLQLMAEGKVLLVEDAAHLYIYVTHGQNTSGDEHHRMLARSLGVSRGRLQRREAAVRDALDSARLDVGEVTVQGSNGTAFVWHRREEEA